MFGKRERKIRRILIVEDEAVVAFDTEHLLGDEGYEVVATVDSLSAARTAIESHPIDLVLTDISLRGEGSGLDVARLARQHGVPVLFVTGQSADQAAGLALGHLAKPYSDRALVGALESCEQLLRGRKVKKLPVGLKLFEPEA